MGRGMCLQNQNLDLRGKTLPPKAPNLNVFSIKLVFQGGCKNIPQVSGRV